MTRIALNTATVLATLVGLAVLWQFRGAALIFCMSLALAAAIRPAIEYFMRRGVHVTLAVAATFLPLLGLIGLLIFLAATRLGDEFNRMADDSGRVYQQIDQHWRKGNWIQREIARSLPSVEKAKADVKAKAADKADATAKTERAEKTATPSKSDGGDKTESTTNAGSDGWEVGVVKTLFGLTLSAAGVIFDVLLVVVMSIYWSLDQVHFERLWLSLLGATTRTPARQIWRAIETEIGKYLRSEFLQSVIAGLLLAFGFSLIGCRYPVLLAIIGACDWLIPWVGVLLAVAALALSSLPALITDDSWHSVLVLGGASLYTCAVLLLLEILVEPRVFNRQRYSTVLIAFVAISLTMLSGIFGLLVGPPLAVVLQVFGNYLLRRRLGLTADTVQTPAEVAARLAALRASLNGSESPAPELISMVDRLSTLVEAARLEIEPGSRESIEKSRLMRPSRTPAGAVGP
jgi:predicted PurR-regulated permease PerM